MDGSRFDAFLRSLARGHSRRALTRVLSSLAFSGTLVRCGVTETAAKGKHHPRHGQAQGKKKKPCPPCKQRKKGKCKGLLPDGSACAGGTCQRGSCLPTASPPGCTPNCVERTCGTDGCGGSCGPCAGNAVCQSGRCVCVPECGGKTCGDDGCGATCGTCVAPRRCQGGLCACPDCPSMRVRIPGTCDCCIVNVVTGSLLEICNPTLDECCSGDCSVPPPPALPFGYCIGLNSGIGCTFDAQCKSGDCRDAGIGVGTCA